MVAVSAESNDTSEDNKNEGSIPIKLLQQEIRHTTIVYNNGTVNGRVDGPINITAEIKYHREGYNYNITEPVMSGTLRTVIDGQVFESQIINGTSWFLYTPTKAGTFTLNGSTSPSFDKHKLGK